MTTDFASLPLAPKAIADFKELLDAWRMLIIEGEEFPSDNAEYLDWSHREGASRKAVEDYVAVLAGRNVVEDSVYAVGRCDQCEEPIEIWRTIGGYLKAYDRDAGDPVPHDCRRISELRAELASLRNSQQ